MKIQTLTNMWRMRPREPVTVPLPYSGEHDWTWGYCGEHHLHPEVPYERHFSTGAAKDAHLIVMHPE